MRALLSLLLVASAATTLHGQRIVPDRFSQLRTYVPALTADGSGTSDALRNALGAPPAAPSGRDQDPRRKGPVRAGVGGFVLGFVIGGIVGAGMSSDNGHGYCQNCGSYGFEENTGDGGASAGMMAVTGGVLGAVIGLAVHRRRVAALPADSAGTSDAPRTALGTPPAAPSGRERDPRRKGQVLAGFGGWALGLMAGGLVGRATTSGDGLAAGGEVAFKALAGATLGSAIGVQLHGKRNGRRSPFIPTLAGSMLGTVLPMVSPVTSPWGAAVGYNAFSRERTEP